MTAVATPDLAMDGPRVQLHPPRHVYPQVVDELLGRVAEAMTGKAWHVSTALFGDDVLVVGLDQDTLQTGLAAELEVWEAAVVQLTAAAELLNPDLGVHLAQPLIDAQLRAEQAGLLLAGVQDTTASDRRGGARRFVAGSGVSLSDARTVASTGSAPALAPGASRHGCNHDLAGSERDA